MCKKSEFLLKFALFVTKHLQKFKLYVMIIEEQIKNGEKFMVQISLCQSYFSMLKQELDVCAGIFDSAGMILAATDDSLAGHCLGKTDIKEYKTYQISEQVRDWALFIESGKNSEAEMEIAASVICASLLAIFKIHTENNDREYFIKQIINGQTEDAPSKARLLKIEDEAIRVVFVIRTVSKHADEALQVIKSLAVGSKDFLFENKAGELVFVRTCKTEPSAAKLYGIAREISESLVLDAFEFASIGIGTVVNELMQLDKSYKSAVNALEIGEIFVNKNKIYAYSNLGISRLISSVPIGKCKAFLNEVLNEKLLNEIDDETLYTIQKFLDYDLNISLAARELYIHRNTLVYRLDRLQKQTGLDVRKFEDAMLFKIAILIHKYLSATRR